jgi:hypothetical protein
MIRIVRQRDVRASRERWLFHGLVRIITHPRPQWKVCPPEIEAAIAPFRPQQRVSDPAATARKAAVRWVLPSALRRARPTTRTAGSGGGLSASPPTPPAAPAL